MPADSGRRSGEKTRRRPRRTHPRSRIAERRQAAGLTQRQVSELTGIPLGTYRRYDRGIEDDPRLRHLVNLARVFDSEVEELVEEGWHTWTAYDPRSQAPPSGTRHRAAAVAPSNWGLFTGRPCLQQLISVQVDMQFADLRTLLRLPASPRDGGANLTTATLAFNLIAGASVLLYRSSVEVLRQRGDRGERFREVLRGYYPWTDGDLHTNDAITALYEWTRNPLAHSLGVGKDRRLFPGAPEIAGKPVSVMIAKRPLSPTEIEVVCTTRERPEALDPTVQLTGK